MARSILNDALLPILSLPLRPLADGAVSLEPILLNALLIVVDRLFIAATAPNAIKAATRAYSIKS